MPVFLGFPGGSDCKESACNARDPGLIPGLGRSPGGGHGNPLQYSCLENPHGQKSLVSYSPWNSPGQNTGVGSLSLLQWIFWPKNQTGVSCIAGGFFTNWAMREAQLGYENLIHPVLQDNTMIRYVWRRLRWGWVRRFSSHQRFLDILLLKLPQGT